MIGESPTRPGIMNAVPPVELPAENRPAASRATAPTVPIRSRNALHFFSCGERSPVRIFWRDSFHLLVESGVTGSYLRNPFRRANRTASAPTRRTWGVSITLRATRIGFFTCSIAATAPATRSSVMIDASIWARPSIRSREPVPAFIRGSSSRATIASVTASSAGPPRSRRVSPMRPASSAPSTTDIVDPAPQWVTMIRLRARVLDAILRSLRSLREAADQILDAGLEVRTDLPQLRVRLPRGARDGPILALPLRPRGAPVEAPEGHDPPGLLDQLGGHLPGVGLRDDNPDLLHQRERERIHLLPRRVDAGAVGAPSRRGDRVEQGLRHHAAERVLHAHEQDGGHAPGITGRG